MQSVIEEMQSTNEELETSKEELQSLNEELSTVNAELQSKVVELTNANNDMNNLLASTDIGTLFVDLQLRITRFTPNATQVINLIQTDVGRPLTHIAANLTGYDRMVDDVHQVLDTLIPKEVEVQTRSGAWFLMRIRSYRTLDNVIEGAVIAFVDITERKRLESLARLAVIVRDSNDAITVQGLDGRILAWNRGAERLYGWHENEAVQMNIADTFVDDGYAAFAATARQLHPGQSAGSFRSKRRTKDGRLLEIEMNITRLSNEAGEMTTIGTTERIVAG
jgi:two-component system CheB/CheR fusion protein